MKSWPGILSTCFLLLIFSSMTADAEHLKIASKDAAADAQIPPDSPALKCPKCQGDMEQGFLLDVRPVGTSGGGYDPEPAEWVQGNIKGGFFFPGLKVKTRHQIHSFRCTNCGYLEMYAK